MRIHFSWRPLRIPLIAAACVLSTTLLSAQTRLVLPFSTSARHIGPLPPRLDTIVVKRTCQLVLVIDGATAADVKNWTFVFAGAKLARITPPGQESAGMVFAVKVPPQAPDPASLLLTVPADTPSVMSPIALHTADLMSTERCEPQGSPESGRQTSIGSGARVTFPAPYDRAHRMANLRLNAFGLPDTTTKGTFGSLPIAITDNDQITVYLDLPDSIRVGTYAVQFSGNIKGDEVSIVGQGDLGKIPGLGRPMGTEGVTTSAVYSLGTFGPYSAPQVTIRILRTVDNKTVVDRSYLLIVRRTYIAALRLGVSRSGVRFSDFQTGARSASDSTRIIRDLSNRHEVRPYLTLVFYGWKFWKRGFWAGRDIEAEPLADDRLNPLVGAGLKKLGDEWLFGFSYEVARGLDVSVAYQAANVQKLQTGFHTDSVFTGDLSPPPSHQWKYGWTVGANLDLRIAGALLSGLLSGNK